MRRKIKNIFLTGLAVVVPIGVTVYILFFLIAMMDGFLAIIPAAIYPDRLLGFHVPGLGVIFTFILIFLVGLITKSWIGNKLVGIGEKFFQQDPRCTEPLSGHEAAGGRPVHGKSGKF